MLFQLPELIQLLPQPERIDESLTVRCGDHLIDVVADMAKLKDKLMEVNGRKWLDNTVQQCLPAEAFSGLTGRFDLAFEGVQLLICKVDLNSAISCSQLFVLF